MAQATIKLAAIFETLGLESPNFMNLYLLVFAKTQQSYFWHFLPKNLKNQMSKIFGGPRALGENGKKLKFFFFFDETQNLKSLWSQDLTCKIWVKLETKVFFSKGGGGPFGIFLIFKKLSKGPPPLNRKKKFCLWFHSNFMCGILRS